jgi:2,4-dienoyl-CoA reductase-like NADH-dependent reductase (Old Yellow Enzyme family)
VLGLLSDTQICGLSITMALATVQSNDGAQLVEPVPAMNLPMPGISYFHPVQHPPPGTFLGMLNGTQTVPMLFRPLTIRSVTFQNRVWVSPMCQYSSEDGQLTDWHVAQLASYACRGASLVLVEAAAVTPAGRTTPEDAGLWKDEQIPSFRRVVEAIHSQGQKAGAQLAHGGRKSSMLAPWLGVGVAVKESNGFAEEVVAPSSIAYDEHHPLPRAMTTEEIEECVLAFGEAARRAVAAGFDVIEIHAAHGYLIHTFLSPVSNQRTDMYGGSFANRIRFALEVTAAVRQAMPEDMPLFFRISATDCLERGRGWDTDDSVELMRILKTHGVDLVDVSTSGKGHSST